MGVVDDMVQLPADHVLGALEHAQESGVAGGGDAVAIDAIETIRGRIEHQVEIGLALPQGLLAWPQRLRHLLLLVDLRV
jgi:hypothetical protein